MACLNFIFFASFRRKFRQLCTHTESEYNCSGSWWFSQQRWHISGKQSLIWIRIRRKSRALSCTAFFMHTLHPHNQTAQSPCWIMNGKMKRKLRSSEQRREDWSWHLQGEEVTERLPVAAPDGCSYSGQTTWPGLSWARGHRRKERNKGTKTSTENGIWSLQAT